jgi:hypothetical protein
LRIGWKKYGWRKTRNMHRISNLMDLFRKKRHAIKLVVDVRIILK